MRGSAITYYKHNRWHSFNMYSTLVSQLPTEAPKILKATDYQPVSDFYAGKRIFVTGGTGFLGKVFIEKLLYSCPKVSRIYLLIREKRNASIEERIKDMISLPLFNRLQNERPQDLMKLTPVAGDITFPKLGLTPEDEKTIINEVSTVFHIAAITTFNEPIQKALKNNFLGTKHVLDLCQRIHDIKAFVHVSTAYSNPNLDVIEELLYPPVISLEEAEQLAERPIISEEETLKILGKSFNTYTFAKGLAENHVAKYHEDIPTAIVRPSIVIASKAGPVPGWVDNWNVATSMIFSLSVGLDRTMLTNSQHTVDLIPVDYVANLAIVVASKLKRSKKVNVYNICTSGENPLTIGEFINISTMACLDYKFDIMPFPKTVLTMSKWLVNLITFLQKLCAMVADWILYFVGQQPRYVKLQALIVRTRSFAEPFTRRTWTINAQNTLALFESLSDTDQKCFDFNPRNIVWEELLSTFIKGVRKYLDKVNPD